MLTFYATLWIDSVILILLSTSLFSCFSQLTIGAWIGFAGAAALSVWRIRRIGWSALRLPRPQGPCEWGLALLIALVFVSLCAGPHCFLDSYGYRFPQMLFWLQEGHPWTVPNVDMRINQMPHVWPLLSAAFYLPFGERGVALPNFLSYLLLAALFRNWAFAATSDHRRASALTLIFAAAPVFIMGASTNDNVVSCVAFLALSFHFALCVSRVKDGRLKAGDGNPGPAKLVAYSALSFALCCGIKPQYLVLAPVWAVWFFFAPVRPYRLLFRPPTSNPKSPPPLLRLLLLFLLLLLCSPAPTMAWNQIKCGSYKSPFLTDAPELCPPPPPKAPVVRSFGILGLQLFDPPINPLFSRANAWIQTSASPAAQTFRAYGIRFRPLPIAEGASFGCFASLVFFCGLLSCLLHRKRVSAEKGAPQIPHRSLALAVFLCLSLAIYATRASSLGRSFIGFLVLLLPTVFTGFPRRISTTLLTGYAVLCLLSGSLVVVMDSARPLWPVEAVARRIQSPALQKQLQDYAHYSRRQFGAKKVLEALPPEERTLGVLVSSGEPIAECWLGRKTPTRVVPYAPTVSAGRLDADGIRYLLMKYNYRVDPATGTLREDFLRQLGGSVAAQASYTTYMYLGDEPWFLVSREP